MHQHKFDKLRLLLRYFIEEYEETLTPNERKAFNTFRKAIERKEKEAE